MLISWKICLVKVFGLVPGRVGTAAAVRCKQGMHLWEAHTFLCWILLSQAAHCHQLVPDQLESSRLARRLKTTKPQVSTLPPEMPGTGLRPRLAIQVTE